MKAVEQEYQRMTGVNLEEQRQIWDERAKGYVGEYQIFQELFFKMGDNCKFLGNIVLPTKDGKTTEMDLVMIHETGIYVFESKHYKGIIYGNSSDKTWTQYFRTVPNQRFKNPIFQNEYHVQALSAIVSDIPIYSVVVFSHEDSDVRVQNNNSGAIVTTTRELENDLRMFLRNKRAFLSADEIERLFSKLSPYSPMQQTKVENGQKELVSFEEFVKQIKAITDEKTALAEQRAENLKQATTKLKRRWRVRMIVLVVCAILVCGTFCLYCNQKVEDAQQELQQVKQDAERAKSFSRVDWENNNNLRIIRDMIKISEIRLVKSPAEADAVLFSCSLTNSHERYGILLNANTKYIVALKNGLVREYEMFGERLAYNKKANILGPVSQYQYSKTGMLKPLVMSDLTSKEEVEYIKITDVSAWEHGEDGDKIVANGLELELYSK